MSSRGDGFGVADGSDGSGSRVSGTSQPSLRAASSAAAACRMRFSFARSAVMATTLEKSYWNPDCSNICRALTCSSAVRSEEHTSELQSRENLVCRLLLEKKKKNKYKNRH